jgi:hypothetical protein
MSELLNTGVTSDTPKNILLGAGTIHKNLTKSYELTSDTALVSGKTYYTRSGSAGSYTYTAVASPNVASIATYYELSWNMSESLMGATSGGNKLTITPEIKDIEADGALVKTKGLTFKVGETATLEINFLEITPDIMKSLTLGKTGSTAIYSEYDEIVAKAQIEAGDYITNLGFVGKTATGDPIIVIFDNALCTSGLSLEGKNKDNNVTPATFECYATLGASLETLPWHILTVSAD